MRQVWRLLKLEDVTSPADNYEVVAGTGERCVPGPHDDCGDGGPATQARLAFPKGLAVSVDRSVYISDGKSVRIVHQNGKISTLIGGHSPTKHLVPIGCDTTYLVRASSEPQQSCMIDCICRLMMLSYTGPPTLPSVLSIALYILWMTVRYFTMTNIRNILNTTHLVKPSFS